MGFRRVPPPRTVTRSAPTGAPPMESRGFLWLNGVELKGVGQ
jgi:hypothetical protein